MPHILAASASAAADSLFPELDGTSSAMRALKIDMMRVASDPYISVLILGESGTGKERIASAIHGHSVRSARPFVVVNCAGISPSLAEDELFGHVRGAFTGAVRDQPGPFERAGGGTVFLDEIGELTPDVQMKLLRVLQQRTVQRLGAGHEAPFDVRVIAATHVDLAHARERGRFREDLFYRLNAYELRVPPLHQRAANDFRALADTIVKRLSARRGRVAPHFSPAVWEMLVGYRWPGNVRELENMVERMLVAAGADPVLTPAHLPPDFSNVSAKPGVRTSRGLPSLFEAVSALQRNGLHIGQTATELGLSRHQLYRLLKNQLQPAQSRGTPGSRASVARIARQWTGVVIDDVESPQTAPC